MDKFLVIDTETTWSDRVMSIGAVVADAYDMRPLATKYYILDPEYIAGGMYSSALGHKRARQADDLLPKGGNVRPSEYLCKP